MRYRLLSSLVTGILLAVGYGLLLLTEPYGRDWASDAGPILIILGLAAVFRVAWRPVGNMEE